MGLFDFLGGLLGNPPSSGASPGAAPQQSGMIGLLSPDDRFMAAMQALSHMGAAMAQPGQSRGQALANAGAGLSSGLQSGMQGALTQKMLGMKLGEEQQKSEWKKTLADAFGAGGMPGPQMAAAPGQTVAQGMADRMNGQRASTLTDPKVQGALLGLYGPQGLAALRQEEKAPETVEGYDPKTGQPVRMMFNRQTGKYDTPVGGSKIDPEKMQLRPDGTVGYLPGVVDSEAKKKGAEAGAAAAATSPYDIAKSWAIPRVLPPGAQVVAGGGPGGAPAQVIMTSPNPSPGSGEGKLQAGVGELQSGTISEWRKNAESAYVQMQNTGRMREALDNGLKTGMAAPVRQATVGALRDLGVSADTLDRYFSAKDAKQFDSASKEIVSSIAKTLGPNPTDADRNFIEAIGPRLRDTPEAVRSLLDWMDKKNQLKVDLYQQGYEAHKKGEDVLQFEQKWWAKNRDSGKSKGGWSVTPVP